jgi:hypothetical protein
LKEITISRSVSMSNVVGTSTAAAAATDFFFPAAAAAAVVVAVDSLPFSANFFSFFFVVVVVTVVAVGAIFPLEFVFALSLAFDGIIIIIAFEACAVATTVSFAVVLLEIDGRDDGDDDGEDDDDVMEVEALTLTGAADEMWLVLNMVGLLNNKTS